MMYFHAYLTWRLRNSITDSYQFTSRYSIRYIAIIVILFIDYFIFILIIILQMF